jgi:hypothetical protein
MEDGRDLRVNLEFFLIYLTLEFTIVSEFVVDVRVQLTLIYFS